MSATKNESISPQRRTRKPKRSSSEVPKKTRGRPRLEPQDETAVDRRRTQIRLAQRAYRQRKESTIVALRKRTNELKGTMRGLGSVFKAFHDKALDLGMQGFDDELASAFKETASTIARLIEDARLDKEDSSDELEKSPKGPDFDSSDSARSDPGAPQAFAVADHTDEADSIASLPMQKEAPPVLGYTMVWETTDDTSETLPPSTMPQHNALDFSPTWADTLDQQDLHWGQPDQTSMVDTASLQAMQDMIMRASPNASLQAPYSYAYHETTFSRRLHRATLEKGIHLIEKRLLKPDVFRKKFQICLPYGDSSWLLGKIRDMLSRDPNAPLDWNDHPLVHLGGAGTHYRKTTQAGPELDESHSVLTQSMGAQTLALLMNATNEYNTQGKTLDITGFEGEWFSPDDVEGYLETKGIRIDPTARIQEVDLIDDPPPSADATGRRDSPPRRKESLDYFPLDREEQRRGSGSFGGGFPPSSDPAAEAGWSLDHSKERVQRSDISELLQALSARQYVQRRTVKIDVDKLVKELVYRATCIGRSPGYRRRDVDAAFRNSTVAAH